MNYKIIDNFLLPEQFKEIKEHLLGPYMEWAYNSFIAKPDYVTENDLYDFQFTHTFYHNCQPQSQRIELINPLIQKINPSAIVRIKANLQPRTEKTVTRQYHYDHDFYD